MPRRQALRVLRTQVPERQQDGRPLNRVTAEQLAVVDGDLAAHAARTDNPHTVTAAQVGSPTLAAFNTHAARHAAAGADPLSVLALGGYPGGTTDFLRADGSFAIPAGGAGSGDVVGPAVAVDQRIAIFSGTTGKLIADGGATIANLLATAAAAAAVAPGLDTQLVFNAGGVFGADAGLTYNKTANELYVAGTTTIADGLLRFNYSTTGTIYNAANNGAILVKGGGYPDSHVDLLSTDAAGTTDYIGLYTGTNGSNASRILSNGNVAIGGITSDAKLSVNGGVHVGGTTDPGDNNLLVDGTGQVTGNVGIGGAPHANRTLSVQASGTGNKEIFEMFEPSLASGNLVYGLIGRAAATAECGFFGYQYSSTPADSLCFYANYGDNHLTAGLIVRKGGLIGLGTSTPLARLSINGGCHIGGDSDPGDNNLIVAGQAAIGTTISTNRLFTVGGAFTGLSTGQAFSVNASISANANAALSGGFFDLTFVEASSGVHPLLASVNIGVAAVTAGAATVTNTASLYIGGPMTAVVSGVNYSIWSAGGPVRLQGLGARVAGDSYLVIDANGNLHVSAIGPAS